MAMLKLACASALLAGVEARLAIRVSNSTVTVWMPSGVCKASFYDNSDTIERYEKMTCINANTLEMKQYSASDSTCVQTPTSTASMSETWVQQGGGTTTVCEETSAMTGYIITETYRGRCGSQLCDQTVIATGTCIKSSGTTSYRVDTGGRMRQYSSTDCSGSVSASERKFIHSCFTERSEKCHDGKDVVFRWHRATVESYPAEDTAGGSAALAPSLLASAVLPCVFMGAIA